MGRNKKEYWYSYLQKAPPGFSNIKRNIGYYTQIADLIIVEGIRIYYDKIKIKFKVNLDKDIDFNETEKMICSDYNLKHITINNSLFKRDGGLFPFILNIKSYDSIENYLSFKKVKSRSDKLKKLLDKNKKK